MILNTEITVVVIGGLFLLVVLAANKLSQVKVNCSAELQRITVLESNVEELKQEILELKSNQV